MFVGVLQIDLMIPASSSLKEKRFVLKSIIDRLKNKFNISIAEVDYNDKWQRALLGVSIVANEKKLVNQVLDKVLNFIDDHDEVEAINHQLEIL